LVASIVAQDHCTTCSYWQLMGEATGRKYPSPRPSEPPTVWDYTQCMEVDSQFFYR
jgi:hypothetical protein